MENNIFYKRKQYNGIKFHLNWTFLDILKESIKVEARRGAGVQECHSVNATGHGLDSDLIKYFIFSFLHRSVEFSHLTRSADGELDDSEFGAKWRSVLMQIECLNTN